MIDFTKEPRRAYEILVEALQRLCSHDPLIVAATAMVADTEPIGPDLLPAPLVAVRSSGLIAMNVADIFEIPTQCGWTISAGDVILVDLNLSGEPGDTILIGQEGDELTVCDLAKDGALIPLREHYDLNPANCLELGVVVEVRRLSSAGKRIIARKTGGQ